MGGLKKLMGLKKLFRKNESKKAEKEENDHLVVSDFDKLESQDEKIEDNSTVTDETCTNTSGYSDENDETLASYHDTLEAENKTKKQETNAKRESYQDQNIWRDVKSIEEKVDNLHIDRAVRPRSDLDKKVDGLLKRKK